MLPETQLTPPAVVFKSVNVRVSTAADKEQVTVGDPKVTPEAYIFMNVQVEAVNEDVYVVFIYNVLEVSTPLVGVKVNMKYELEESKL